MNSSAEPQRSVLQEEWQCAFMVVALPLAIAAVSFGCQFFL
jgi:hypothetical protein